MAVNIPMKGPGKKYSVELRTREFSYMKSGLQGAFASSAYYPQLELDDKCVCCNNSSQGEYIPVTPTAPSDNFEAEPVDIPVCMHCKEHALTDTQSEGTVGIAIVVGIALGVLGYHYKSIWGYIAGGVVIALSSLWIWKEKKRLQKAPIGHFPGFGLQVAADQLIIQTPNRVLVEKIVQTHSELVHKVR